MSVMSLKIFIEEIFKIIISRKGNGKKDFPEIGKMTTPNFDVMNNVIHLEQPFLTLYTIV